MDSENIENKKYLITWWDLVDHYLLAAMLVVSVGSFGLQSTQDRLICLPAVNRSPITAGNDSAPCNGSSSSVVSLFKMPDRRHYDYVDNECYVKMYWFSLYYSLIFFVETLILVVISNYWQKFPKSANAVARCEHLISECNKGEFLITASAKDLLQRLEVLLDCYNQEDPKENPQERNCIEACIIGQMRWSCVTVQYRIRGLCGFLAALGFFIFNLVCYVCRYGWNRCNLDDVDYATEVKCSFFQCSRTIGSYFHIATYLFLVFITVHLFLALKSLYWAYFKHDLSKKTPTYIKTNWNINKEKGRCFSFYGDAAFLLHLLEASGCHFVETVIKKAEAEEATEVATEEAAEETKGQTAKKRCESIRKNDKKAKPTDGAAECQHLLQIKDHTVKS